MAEFRLYDGATARLLGVHRTTEAAYAAADEHSLLVLAQTGDWVTVEHVIAYVDDAGRIQLSSELTQVGPPNDVEGCRAWLRGLPGRRGVLPD